MEPRPKNEGSIIPPHWKFPRFEQQIVKVVPDLGFLHQTNTYALKGRVETKVETVETRDTEYFFNDDGDIICKRDIFRSNTNTNPYYIIVLSGDSARSVCLVREKDKIGRPYTYVSLYLREFFGGRSTDTLASITYIPDYGLGHVEEPKIHFSYIYAMPYSRARSPLIDFIPVHSPSGEIVRFEPDASVFKFQEERYGYSLEDSTDDLGQYTVKREGVVAYIIRSYVDSHGIAVIEQEYAHEGNSGNGTVKVLRLNLGCIDLTNAIHDGLSETFDPTSGEFKGSWRYIGELLGNPFLSFRGPIRELLEATTLK